MPCLAFVYNPVIGPLIQVAVFPFSFVPPSVAPNQAQVPVSLYGALIDTGASCTCLSAKIVNDLGLNPIGKQIVGGVHGNKAANQYQFQVGVLFGHQQVAPTEALQFIQRLGWSSYLRLLLMFFSVETYCAKACLLYHLMDMEHSAYDLDGMLSLT